MRSFAVNRYLVVIPAYNEQATIEQVVQLSRQGIPRK